MFFNIKLDVAQDKRFAGWQSNTLQYVSAWNLNWHRFYPNNISSCSYLKLSLQH